MNKIYRGGAPTEIYRVSNTARRTNANRVDTFDVCLSDAINWGGLQNSRVYSQETSGRGSETGIGGNFYG